MSRKFSLLLLHFLLISWIKAEPLVQVNQGILKGTFQESRNGRRYSAFLGIPYAKPPIGNLRFSNPVPADNWHGTRQADSFGNICPQSKKEISGNEDCLFLNVYSPLLEFSNIWAYNFRFPVMVWIHGGAFVGGSGNFYSAKYLLDKDIILVTINYRLGIFGFLSTGDSVAPGNFGLKDQVLALKWVQENIHFFGGDRNRVTIFGESAGGVSVSLHALSKASNGLFHQYIVQSGSALCPWAYQKRINFLMYVKEISTLVFCNFDSFEKIVNCLRERKVETLIKTSSLFDKIARFAQLTWTPTDEPDIDGAFLTKSPRELIKLNQMKDLPSISGINSDEGLLITKTLYSNPMMYSLLKLILNPLIVYISYYYLNPKDKVKFTKAVEKYYFNNSVLLTGKDKFLESLTRFISDGFFLYPEIRTLEKVTPKKNSPNYLYCFGYRGSNSFYSGVQKKRNLGVGHADDVIYLFPLLSNISESNLNYRTWDLSMSGLMVDLWTSFAINGKPYSEKLSNPYLWVPYDTQNKIFLQIGEVADNTNPSVTLSNSFFPDRMNFWRKNIPI